MSTYESQLSDYIEGWLNTFVPQNPSFQKSDASTLNWNDMPTPPSSDPGEAAMPIERSRRRSPRRLQRHVPPDLRRDSTPEALGDDPFHDQTPKGPSRTTSIAKLPERPLNAPSLPPSSSVSRASKASRSSSPVKRKTLDLLQKPVRFVPMIRSQLPSNFHKTFDNIFSIVDKNAYIPQAVEKDLQKTGNPTMPRWFFKHNKNKISEYQTELAALEKIRDETVKIQTYQASEAEWNLEVHGPLLELALRQLPLVQRNIITTASISKPFVPDTRIDSYYDTSKSKMIDFGLTATPSEHTAAHLAGILDTLPVTERTVNQTTYGSVTKNPIAVSIEIKTSSGSLEEANAQLGLWIAAWHKRMNLLKQCHEDIITLPLIIVMEHEWKLLFAVDQGDSIDIFRDICIGDTRDLSNLYTIIAVLKELGEWIQTDYLAWLDRWLGIAPPLEIS
ncbi:hypothetical protein FLAG1_12089 [Fusarium langsethiae]|uniref:PD-(D/E)XK nuclease-like domain-containing protein n=1 Tax=Fusarium langsethiae TaxID=179993 RepID=A0A0N0DAE6_FUSLA|nr:hypothetical protein FLAG1_12089 [Fusarium langsethiae]GKU11075.1 unnamed protein product [Fusarium langsethiae]GKU16734.1 unnamed protein product [Fusarium langsethiae]